MRDDDIFSVGAVVSLMLLVDWGYYSDNSSLKYSFTLITEMSGKKSINKAAVELGKEKEYPLWSSLGTHELLHIHPTNKYLLC